MDMDKCRLRVCQDVTFQSMGEGEQTVVLALKSGQLYTCNETTESFLKSLDGKRTFAEVVALLAREYDVDSDRLKSDLIGIAEELLGEKLIAEVQQP